MGTYWIARALSLQPTSPICCCDVADKQLRVRNQQYLGLSQGAKRTAEEAVACFVASAALAFCCSLAEPPPLALAALSSTHTPSQASPQRMTLSDPTSPCTSIAGPSPKYSGKDDKVSNEYIVAEAWKVVNERFLDARSHKWSSEAWLNKWEDVLRRPIPSRMAAYDIIKKMLSELHDPYTRFITPAELKQLSKYDMTGIGISIGEAGDEDNDATLRVVGVVLGSSGQLAGIKQGDEILSVNGVDIHGKSAFEASSLIQGIKGTFVSVEVRHGLCKDTQSLSIERKQTVQTPVYFRLEHRGGDLLGYIHLKEFNAVARRHLVTAMNKLTAAGATSFVLDLRNNPGGLVQVGVEIARLFLDKGDTVVYTVSRNPQDQKGIFAKSPPLTKAPLVILVNEHTASASEIVAASLQDNCRAVLVGHRTFGKGLIQSVFELSDGSGVILTVGMYVTPHHHEIDQNGIYPDFQELPDLVDVNKKIQMCVSS
ncbi:hypothetical protein GOP47_0027803 [Adiantum capillus-veneris]|nr:hypothetical protein GOP47_0027803 [Adiantum capillus-veneris]